MNVEGISSELVERAVVCGQAVVRLERDAAVEELRQAVRLKARALEVKIRTGMLDDVLAVVRADAVLWDEPTAIMRVKLDAPATPNVVG